MKEVEKRKATFTKPPLFFRLNEAKRARNFRKVLLDSINATSASFFIAVNFLLVEPLLNGNF